MARIIINADGEVYGRLCSYAAKQALEGNEIVVVNSEKVVITGRKMTTIEKHRTLKQKGGYSLKGPKYSKISYKILKRGIRGMLPDHRKGIGKEAFLKIKCYDGIPAEFAKEKMVQIKKPTQDKFISLKELVKKI